MSNGSGRDLHCKDCHLFDESIGTAGSCGWEILECKGPKSLHANVCPLFTQADGYMPLLDCDEADLPAWARQDQADLFLQGDL